MRRIGYPQKGLIFRYWIQGTAFVFLIYTFSYRLYSMNPSRQAGAAQGRGLH